MENIPTLIPLDFNSLCTLEGQNLKLSNYYIDYALRNEGFEPSDKMHITFYDKYWTADSNEIVCLDATLKKDITNADEPWMAQVRGCIYTSHSAPKRKYFSSFIGANTIAQQNGGLGNVTCFLFAPGSELPNFSRIVGKDAVELNGFFHFKDINYKPPIIQTDGKMAGDTLVARGGGSKNEKVASEDSHSDSCE